ncbi:hypothetical protein ACTFIW_003270 [Dictyostelium discoideum]
MIKVKSNYVNKRIVYYHRIIKRLTNSITKAKVPLLYSDINQSLFFGVFPQWLGKEWIGYGVQKHNNHPNVNKWICWVYNSYQQMQKKKKELVGCLIQLENSRFPQQTHQLEKEQLNLDASTVPQIHSYGSFG